MLQLSVLVAMLALANLEITSLNFTLELHGHRDVTCAQYLNTPWPGGAPLKTSNAPSA